LKEREMYGDSLTDRVMDFMVEKVLFPMMVWVLMPALAIALIVIPILAIKDCSSGKAFVCGHQPHMGACTEKTTTYMLVGKVMTPITSTCGCVSSHGITVEAQTR
jgi:hypothetical protein